MLALLAALALATAAGWLWRQGASACWAREVALPEIERLLQANDYYAAYWLARQAEAQLPGDPRLARFWRDRCYPVSIERDPPGAEIFEAIVRQLDPPDQRVAKEEARVIRLKAGLAQGLAALVEKSLGSQATKVKVQVDALSNSLVVTGANSILNINNDLLLGWGGGATPSATARQNASRSSFDQRQSAA